jgi:hypothetical protein
MVQRCLNPACRQEFQLLQAGDLYALEREPEVAEFLWLCRDCASGLTPLLDESGVVRLSHHGERREGNRTPLHGELRLISRSARPACRPDSRPTAERKYSFVYGPEPHLSGYHSRAWIDAWHHMAARDLSIPTAA